MTGCGDMVTNEMAYDVVRACLDRLRAPDSGTAYSEAATLMAKLALARQIADNVTVVIVDLRNPAKPQ